MKNIWREILKELPDPKIEILTLDHKDNEVAKQYSALLSYKIVESRSDTHPECGYPMGQILCRSQEEAEDYVAKSEFTDCYIRDY